MPKGITVDFDARFPFNWVQQSRCRPILRYRKRRNLDLFTPWAYVNSAMNTMYCYNIFPIHGELDCRYSPFIPDGQNIAQSKVVSGGWVPCQTAPASLSFVDGNACRHTLSARKADNSYLLYHNSHYVNST